MRPSYNSNDNYKSKGFNIHIRVWACPSPWVIRTLATEAPTNHLGRLVQVAYTPSESRHTHLITLLVRPVTCWSTPDQRLRETGDMWCSVNMKTYGTDGQDSYPTYPSLPKVHLVQFDLHRQRLHWCHPLQAAPTYEHEYAVHLHNM